MTLVLESYPLFVTYDMVQLLTYHNLVSKTDLTTLSFDSGILGAAARDSPDERHTSVSWHLCLEV